MCPMAHGVPDTGGKRIAVSRFNLLYAAKALRQDAENTKKHCTCWNRHQHQLLVNSERCTCSIRAPRMLANATNNHLTKM